MSGGYFGKLLFVDLDSQKVRIGTRDEFYFRRYLGGYGVGVETLFRNQPPGADPYGPAAMLGFLPGLLTGTGAPFSGRYCVVAKSPLTGGWGDSNAGGTFGPALKRTGLDGVFVSGVADEPLYLLIDDDGAELRDASTLWGEDCYRTDEMIRESTGVERAKVAAIGPAGERRVRFACIINDHGRAAGRSGLGAAMGAKRLKAIAVHGTQRPPVADKDRFKQLRREVTAKYRFEHKSLMRRLFPYFKPFLPPILKRGIFPSVDIKTQIQMFKEHGTTAMTAISAQCGDAPIKNWRGVGARDFPMWTHANRISDSALDEYKEKRYACHSCPVGCGAIFRRPEQRNTERGEKEDDGTEKTHRPEYETIAEFGMMILNDDPDIVIEASDRCNRLGVDTISAGSTIAFAFECFERGIITADDLGGLTLEWGDGAAALQLLEQITARDGVGDILAEGTKRAAEALGGDAADAAIEVGGQELPMHDPRLNPSFATTYLTDPTPGRHTQGGAGFYEWGMMSPPIEGIRLPKLERYEYEHKGYSQAFLSRVWQVLNALGLCMFSVQFAPYPFVAMIEAVTGWDYSVEELLATGERIQTLRQAFNVREGVVASQFSFPDRALGKPPLRSGPTALVSIDLETMAQNYYDEMGWHWETGQPHRQRLEALGLDFVARELYE